MAKAAEDYGFHAFWVWDVSLYAKDAYIALTLAAVNTEKIILGPGVSNPLTRHLSITANAIATLDDLSEGRAVLGFGRGAPGSANAVGFPTPRIEIFRENLVRLSALVRGEVLVLDEAVRYRVQSVQRPIPLYLAVWGPRMIQLAGELTDGALIAGPTQKELMGGKMRQVLEAAKAAGRDPRQVEVNLQLTLSTHPDPQMAIDDLRPLIAYQIRRGPLSWEDELPPEHADEVRRIRRQFAYGDSPTSRGTRMGLVSDALVKYVGIVGTEDECRERLADILTLRPDSVTFRLAAGDRMQRLKRLAALVSKVS
ncbi:MAG: LLM class flavin-dependent oxidoreductase [Chloroflexi bacterium]|nr:LLM class flavin-dependent oxidoreductase [Chloroflexota bacterium]